MPRGFRNRPYAARAAARVATVACLLAMLAGCGPEPSTPSGAGTGNTSAIAGPGRTAEAASGLRFRDVTEAVGLRWTYRNDEEAGRFSIVESMGGGVGLCDFDQDGRLDVAAAGGGLFSAPRACSGLGVGLFRQSADGQFEDVSAASGIDRREHYNHGIAAGDFNHDGFPDVAVTGFGGLTLFCNQGDGTFAVDERLQPLFAGGWSTSAGWGDVNGDGDPDLVVVHYADWSFDNDPVCPGPAPHPRDVCPPRRFHGLPDQLFLSDGLGGFVESSEAAGLRRDGKGIGLSLVDLDLDGALDLYVANDTDPNHLYQNDGRGRFTELGMASGAAMGADGNADGSMGVDVADFNGDGLPDLWVANFERESFALYHNLGGCQFQHVSRQVGIAGLPATYVGWGTIAFDADGDGDPDVFVANGHVVRFPTQSTVRQLPLLLENLDGLRYRNVADAAGEYFRSPHSGRGVAAGDLDGDGAPDLVISHVNEPVAVLRNESPGWRGLAVRLIGRTSPRVPVGAAVRLTAGERTTVQQLKGASSYASTSAPTLFFGLGSQAARRMEIQWPSGVRQVVEPVPAGPSLTLIEPH